MSDGFESERPPALALGTDVARKLPLHAFGLLEGGDAFEVVAGPPPRDGVEKVNAYLASKVTIQPHGAPSALVEAVKAELCTQLRGSPQLIARLSAARPIEIELIPRGKTMAAFGFPKRASAMASGLFWDDPSWPKARIGLLVSALETERALVTHEMAHAIQRLAFTDPEQELIYRLMLPVYRYRSWVDEVFAIYSEREVIDGFSENERHAAGVYGLARQRWDERHVFTRFVRQLYHPHKPLAGQPRAPPRNLLG